MIIRAVKHVVPKTLSTGNFTFDDRDPAGGLDASFAKRYPHQMSGGQARRVGVARALMLNPSLIIADEPTAGLDVSIQGDVLNLLNEIQERTSVAILLITHNMSVVRHCADRVAVLLRGKVVETGPSAQIFSGASHEYTRDLITASQHAG